MAHRPSFQDFVWTVAKRSFADWHGTGGWFALAAYATVLVLMLTATGVIATILGDIANKLLAGLAILWLVILFFIVTPFRLWQDDRYRVNLIAEAGQPRIHVDWNFNARKRAELVLTNTSAKTIDDYELKLREFRNADGSQKWLKLVSLPSVDGRRPPISLNPLDSQHFEFAELKSTGGEGTIAILPATNDEKWLGKECGVRLSSTGKDIAGSKIELRLKIDNNKILIESWNANENAVSVDDTGLT